MTDEDKYPLVAPPWEGSSFFPICVVVMDRLLLAKSSYGEMELKGQWKFQQHFHTLKENHMKMEWISLFYRKNSGYP